MFQLLHDEYWKEAFLVINTYFFYQPESIVLGGHTNMRKQIPTELSAKESSSAKKLGIPQNGKNTFGKV